MKKIISAEQQWRDEMNALINEGNECYACCDGLGAVGDNECYNIYGNAGVEILFTKVGDKFEKIYYTDVSEEYLLATNWQKLNPDEDWYDLKAVLQFLIRYEKGKNPTSPIAMQELLWMGIFTDGDYVRVMTFEDKEVEVSTEEIEAIRKEIIERCKGHSIEEIRDMFDGYNWGEYGEGSFDFLYKDFIFSIQNTDNAKAEGDWFLSCIVCNEWSESDSFKTTTLPIPPKEIKVDVEPAPAEKPDLTDWGMTISYDYIVQRMRESCICRISDIYQKIGKPFVKLDLAEWRHEEHCYFAEYDEGYAVALTKNYEGNVVIAGCSVYDVNPEWCINKNWSFVSLEEMLHIINQLTSK